MNKIEILARIFYDIKGLEKYRGLKFSLSDREEVIVRGYFLKYGLKATSIYNSYNIFKNE